LDNDYSLDSLISEIAREETIYDRSYQGRVIVNIDPIRPKSGKVLCLVPDLGWDDPTTAAWCYPRQLHAMSVPKIGSLVEVSFLRGDMDWPVYRCLAQESSDAIPSNYDGLPTTHVVFESPLLKQGMVVDDLTAQVTILSKLLLKLGDKTATSPVVKGDQLLTFLGQLVTTLNALITKYNAHVHPETGVTTSPPSGAPATAATAPTSALLSTSVFTK